MAKKAEKAKLAKKAAKQQRKVLKAKKILTKVKKKKWVPIYSPPFFGDMTLGDCFVEEQEQALNRKIKVSMMNLTRESRKQATSIMFQAIQTKGPGVQTAMCGYEISHQASKRLVRKGRTKIADSFLIQTKDKKVCRIKPYIVSRSKIPNSLQTKMRLLAREFLAREAGRQSFQKLMEDIIQGKVQKAMKINLQKLYPLSACEIRKLSIERSETPLELGDTKMEMPVRRPRGAHKGRPPRRDSRHEAKAPAEKPKESTESVESKSEQPVHPKAEKKEQPKEAAKKPAKETPKEAAKEAKPAKKAEKAAEAAA